MKLITKSIYDRLVRNGQIRHHCQEELSAEPDFLPVVKLFTPDAQCTWLLTEIDPEDPDIAYGLCDLGLGFVELGPVSLTELESLRGKLGLPVERDRHFTTTRTVGDYAKEARGQGHIKA